MKPRHTTPIVLIAIISLFILSYLILEFLPNSSQPPTEIPAPLKIIDGDTFKLNGETIRLLCVDTPEKGKQGYEEASDFLFQMIYNKNITLEGNKTDKYGRSLKWVYADGVLVNKKIIDFGYGSLFEFEGEDCSLVS